MKNYIEPEIVVLNVISEAITDIDDAEVGTGSGGMNNWG